VSTPAPPPATAIHRMVDLCRAAQCPAMVAKVPSGWVVMGDRQVFAGYCLLIPDPVVPHLNALAVAGRRQFLSDMTLVGDALMSATAALRINYAMFGNLEPALHAHVFPRYVDEPPATRTAQPWALDWSLAPEYSEALYGDLQRRIGEYLHIAVRS
jgi:diadenosine tetraphosphate (Ap4A) HIT family hydrolase